MHVYRYYFYVVNLYAPFFINNVGFFMDEHGYYITNLLNEGTNVGEFNTQLVEQISQSSPIPISPQTESTTKKFRGGNFSIEEDLVLISGWLNISWSTIQLATNKFCGCFDQIERLNQSGLT